MKHALLFLAVCSSIVLYARNSKPINPIIGDQSYVMIHGEMPTDQTNDQERIKAHLSYAEFLLRTVDVSSMSEEQQAQRDHTLDLLHEYWTRGIFPMNVDYAAERQPCFIDDNGTICAVGYLVEQTAGRDVAELISQRHLYKTILEMKDPVLDEWVKSTGLTLEECAIIQPSYHRRPVVSWHVAYGVSYRAGDNFYQSFELYRNGDRNYYERRFSIHGVTFDWLRHGNFSAGIKAAGVIRSRGSGRNRSDSRQVLAFVQPEAFCYNKAWGMNLRPGLEWRTAQSRWLTLGLNYSYAIPVIFESAYGAGRHNFTAKISVNLNKTVERFPKRPPKPKEEKEPDA